MLGDVRPDAHKDSRQLFLVGLAFPGRLVATPNDPKLSDRDLSARVAAGRRKAKARRMPGFMAGAYAVTEPVELGAAHR